MGFIGLRRPHGVIANQWPSRNEKLEFAIMKLELGCRYAVMTDDDLGDIW